MPLFFLICFKSFCTVLCPFSTREHVLGVTFPLPYRHRSQGTPLPQRDSPFLQKGRCTKASHRVILLSIKLLHIASLAS
jgi:hypothetical protein